MSQAERRVEIETRTSRAAAGMHPQPLAPRTAAALAMVCISVFFALSLAVDARRLLWYDEISTLALARLPSMASIWSAMYKPIDASTPTYLLLERLFDSAFHQTALSARLLSSLAVAAGLGVVYNAVARLAGGLFGLIAVGLLVCSFLPYYSYEARAYGLDFFISALALWVWLHVNESSWRFPLLFGVCCFLGELTHYYFALCLVPYFVYELLAGWRRRQVFALIGGCTGVLFACGILLPAALAIRALSKQFWAQITLSSLNVFEHFFPYAMAPLAGVAICLTLLSFVHQRPNAPLAGIGRMSPAEQLGWLFLLIPITGMAVGRLVTHAFVDRYFIGFLPGVAMAAACFCSRLMQGGLFAPGAVALVLLGFGLGQQTMVAAHPEIVDPFHDQQTKTRYAMMLEPVILKDSKRFIVVADPLLFLESHFYSHHPNMYPYIPVGGETTEAITLTNMAQLGLFQLWTMDELMAHGPEIALIDPTEGLVRQLRRNGYKLTVRTVYPLPIVYIEK